MSLGFGVDGSLYDESVLPVPGTIAWDADWALLTDSSRAWILSRSDSISSFQRPPAFEPEFPGRSSIGGAGTVSRSKSDGWGSWACESEARTHTNAMLRKTEALRIRSARKSCAARKMCAATPSVPNGRHRCNSQGILCMPDGRCLARKWSSVTLAIGSSQRIACR